MKNECCSVKAILKVTAAFNRAIVRSILVILGESSIPGPSLKTLKNIKLLQLFHGTCYYMSGDVHLVHAAPPVECTSCTALKAWVSCSCLMTFMRTLRM